MAAVTVITRQNTMTGAQRKAPRCGGASVECASRACRSVDAGPGLAATEHAAEGAALNAQTVSALQRDRRIVGAAGIRIENPAAPLVLARLHVDQDLLAVRVRFLVDGIAADIRAALFDPHLAFLLFRQPHAER